MDAAKGMALERTHISYEAFGMIVQFRPNLACRLIHCGAIFQLEAVSRREIAVAIERISITHLHIPSGPSYAALDTSLTPAHWPLTRDAFRHWH